MLSTEQEAQLAIVQSVQTPRLLGRYPMLAQVWQTLSAEQIWQLGSWQKKQLLPVLVKVAIVLQVSQVFAVLHEVQ